MAAKPANSVFLMTELSVLSIAQPSLGGCHQTPTVCTLEVGRLVDVKCIKLLVSLSKITSFCTDHNVPR